MAAVLRRDTLRTSPLTFLPSTSNRFLLLRRSNKFGGASFFCKERCWGLCRFFAMTNGAQHQAVPNLRRLAATLPTVLTIIDNCRQKMLSVPQSQEGRKLEFLLEHLQRRFRHIRFGQNSRRSALFVSDSFATGAPTHLSQGHVENQHVGMALQEPDVQFLERFLAAASNELENARQGRPEEQVGVLAR